MKITAEGAMVAILDLNELINEIKNKNTGTSPDLTLCKVSGYLADYREILLDAMARTEIEF